MLILPEIMNLIPKNNIVLLHIIHTINVIMMKCVGENH